jgi:GNAT superfamily N-acetyltransferase
MGATDPVPIRAATVADVETLAALRAAFLAEVSGADPTDPRLLDALRRYFRVAVPAGEFVAHIAETAETAPLAVATGGLVFHRHAPSAKSLDGLEGYVMNMYTAPAWRGRGIAGRLLQLLLANARRRGCARVSLHAVPPARPLYAQAGFAAVDSEMRLTFDSST